MRYSKVLRIALLIILAMVLLVACGTGKKPNVPIPTVVAVLEKPYADVETQPIPTEAPTFDPAYTPGEYQPPVETSKPIFIPTPNRSSTAPLSGTATLMPGNTPYPGNVPTVSFQDPDNPYPIGTPTSPTNNPNLPAGLANGSAVYTLNNAINQLANQSLTAINQDQSAVWARNTAQLALVSPTANCSGLSSSLINSRSSGLNACLLSMEGSTLQITSGNVITLGTGSTGLFALGNASKVIADRVTVSTTGDSARGASAENGGSLDLLDVSLSTVGPNATGVSINLGGSNAMLRDTVVTTSGVDAPCFYTNVTLRTETSSCSASQAEVAIVENNGNLELRNTDVTSSVLTRWGVLLYQSTSRDATTATARFSMQGGTLNIPDANSPVFFVTNVNAIIDLRGAIISSASKVILKAGAQDTWGTIGENGGSVSILLTGQQLNGDIQTDRLSSVVIQMRENSFLEGAINAADNARSLALSLDSTSSWTLTRNSYVPQISGVVLVDNRVVNITGNNFNLYYDPGLSSTLGGNTYQLTNGGTLSPHP